MAMSKKDAATAKRAVSMLQNLGIVVNFTAVAPPVATKPLYYTAEDIAAGRGWPCTAPNPCSRLLRSERNASRHGYKHAHKRG